VSFAPGHPSRLGLVIPEDLASGLLRPDETFAFDGVLEWSVDDPTIIARHPVEGGKRAVTDARLKADGIRAQATYLLTDTPEQESPWAVLKDQDTFRGVDADGNKFGFLPAVGAALKDRLANQIEQGDRCVRRLNDFKRFAARNDAVTIAFPGETLRRMAIGTIGHRPQGSGAALLVMVAFEELRIVTLRTVAQIPDADLAAAGFGGNGGPSQVMQVGVIGGG
jgi:hypothetical protein